MAEALLDRDLVGLSDLVDQLRPLGIHHKIPLPQVIVCGEQSVGKSSLLEAISGIKFSVSNDHGTQFPIRVVLRRSRIETFSVRIQPGHCASDGFQEAADCFKSNASSVNALPDIVKEAISFVQAHNKHDLSNHTLRIEAAGPTMPHLTLVDLPGLVSGRKEGQAARIQSLVKHFMEDEKSVILAVLSGEKKLELQQALTMAREVDKNANRSLVVITQPDLTDEVQLQTNVLSYFNRAKGRWQTSWHVIKNKIDLENIDLAASEASFFSQSQWDNVAGHQRGISALHERLSQALCRQIAIDTSPLINEIQTRLEECREIIRLLGDRREEFSTQQSYVISTAERFGKLIENALSLRYNDVFFTTPETRLRTKISQIQDDFASHIRHFGRTYDVRCDHDKCNPRNLFSPLDQSETKISDLDSCSDLTVPEIIDCRDFAVYVQEQILHERTGVELPMCPDQAQVGRVFRALSTKWEEMALGYCDKVFLEASEFVERLVLHLAGEISGTILLEHVLRPRMEYLRSALKVKTSETMAPYREHHTMSWNPALFKYLSEASEQRFRPAEHALEQRSHYTAELHVADLVVHQAGAYYEVAQHNMVDNMAAFVIENGFLRHLKTLFRPSDIPQMDQDLIGLVGAEAPAIIEQRINNQHMQDTLEDALRQCEEYRKALFRSATNSSSTRYRLDRSSLPSPVELRQPTTPTKQSPRIDDNTTIDYVLPAPRTPENKSERTDLAEYSPSTAEDLKTPSPPELIKSRSCSSSPGQETLNTPRGATPRNRSESLLSLTSGSPKKYVGPIVRIEDINAEMGKLAI